MPSLEVPGALLHYEAFGSGPILLFIPGADGRGSIFHAVADLLATSYTCICWDRRGYSQSFLHGPQDFAQRLSTDTDDAAALIRHAASASGQIPSATVFGTSSGAIVAQALLVRHPDCIKTLICHEPPLFDVLPEQFSEQGKGLVHHIYDIYRAQGPAAAMEAFTAGLSEGEDGATMRQCMNANRGDEIRANSLFWFEFELRQYPCAEVDLKGLVRNAAKLVPAAGAASGDGPGVGPIAVIAQATGRPLVRLAGGHVGFMTHPQEWTASLRAIFKD